MNVSLRYISVCLSLFTLLPLHFARRDLALNLATRKVRSSYFTLSYFTLSYFTLLVSREGGPLYGWALVLAMATVVVGRRRRRRREEETGGEGVATSTLTYHTPSLLPASEERCGRVCKSSDHRLNAHLRTTCS